MFKRLSISLISLAAAVFFFASGAWAGDAASGGQVFTANCAACHAGGNNLVNAQKTLRKADLEKYGKDSIEAIVTQVTYGKNAMPAFGGRLTAGQIEDVATYVLSQADKGW